MDWLSWLDKGRWDNKYRADEKTLIDSLTTNKLEHKERDDGVEMGEINSDLKTGKRNNKKDTTERFTAHSPKFHRDIIQPREHKGDSVPKMDELNISIADSMKSWESWLDKKNRTINDDFPKGKPPHIDYNKTPDNETDKTIPTIIRAFEDEKDEDPMVYDSKNASWESWLDKNNAIETDHKNDKKEEWDGKFSSSTTRDDVKDDENDDDKAVSEEESLEELTDGELVEIEKLKSWETWLEKDALTNAWIETIPKKPRNNSMIDSQSYSRQSTGTRYEQDPTGKRSASSSKWSKLGDLGEIKYDRILNNEGEKTDKHVKNHNAGGSKRNALAHGNKKRQQNAATKKPTPPTGKAPTGVGKAWEAWLTKQEKTREDKILDLRIAEETAIREKKISAPKIKPDAGVDAKIGEFSNIQAEKLRSATVSPLDSWANWLEKQQGAGDARFGNQHLTGLDQEPVNNEEDEANILPAKDTNSKENDEKQEETEDKEGKDNKPYKALSHE